MRFSDLVFRQMAVYSQFHGPGEMQARCSINGREISVRRGGKYIDADGDHPYEVLADSIEFEFMTSSEIDRLFAHLETGGDPEEFERN